VAAKSSTSWKPLKRSMERIPAKRKPAAAAAVKKKRNSLKAEKN
jgi:hypothetical protein